MTLLAREHRGDRFLRSAALFCVWLMTRQLAADVNMVEEAELRRLEDGASPALAAKVGRVRGPSVLQKRRMEEQSCMAVQKRRRQRRGDVSHRYNGHTRM